MKLNVGPGETVHVPIVVTRLDWRRHRVGPLRACWRCGRKAMLRDASGRPCHKVCAERDRL